eukprot:TRINITY_DN697_c0_g1_i1.p1 TRINITY_DN697_c0_g1~~TRINITY_DN697_c0_g1_i1.p1  ORF type:complete len:172 (+),score=35.49 TRINITY_DN697_c0_g1_i1:39-554(+)
MSCLSKDQLVEAVNNGEIIINPFNPDSVGCASIDFSLGNEFRHYSDSVEEVVLSNESNYRDYMEKVVVSNDDYYLLPPHGFCLGITREEITLSPKLCAMLNGRSRFARLGLTVHITAGFIQPGVKNQTVLEIFNASNKPIKLKPGIPFCQMTFFNMTSESNYKGQFMHQEL